MEQGTPPSKRQIVPLESLRKEQLAALAVLSEKRNSYAPSTQVPRAGDQIPATGYTLFTSVRLTPRHLFASERHWCWTQSHRKVYAQLHSEVVVMQKFTPKKISPATLVPVPRYKVWLLMIEARHPVYFLWVERGAGCEMRPQSPSASPKMTFMEPPGAGSARRAGSLNSSTESDVSPRADLADAKDEAKEEPGAFKEQLVIRGLNIDTADPLAAPASPGTAGTSVTRTQSVPMDSMEADGDLIDCNVDYLAEWIGHQEASGGP